MAKIPDSIDGSTRLPTPQRRIWSVDTSAVSRQAERDAVQMQRAGDDLMVASEIRQKTQDRDSLLDATARENQAQREVMDLLYGKEGQEGLYSSKGANAMGVEKTFNDRFNEIRQRTMDGVGNKAALAALQKSMDSMYTSNLDNVKRFTMQERRGYAGELLDARARLAQEKVGLEYNNQNTLDAALTEARSTAGAAAKMKGFMPGDEAYNRLMRDQESSVYSTQLASMFSSNDVATQTEALRLFDKYQSEGKLNLESVQKYDQVAGQLRPKVEALTSFQKLQGTYRFDIMQADQIFGSMLQAESGTRHYDESGKVITSPAGAKGIAQLMPDTAKMMAKELGIDPSTWQVPEVNQYLGQMYFQKMQNKYGNNTLAVMAYNAGPGAVDDFMNGTNKTGKNDKKLKLGDPTKGEVPLDYFIAQFPFKETSQYVTKVMGGTTGTPRIIDPVSAQKYASSMTPEAGKEFMSLVENNNTAITAQRDMQRRSLVDQALNVMQTSGQGFSAIPVDLRAQADEAGVLRDLEEYTGQTDPQMANYLYGLDPATLAKTDLSDPSYRLKLSPEDYQRWTAKKEAMGNVQNLVTEERRKKLVREAFIKRNISSSTKEGQGQALRFNELLDLEIDAFSSANNGRYPNEGELTGIVDNLFIKGDYDTKPWWPGGGGNDYVMDISVEELPKAERKKITEALQTAGVPVTDSAIIKTWIRQYYGGQ